MINKVRVFFQFLFLSLLLYVGVRPVFDKAYIADFEAYCPMGGISSLFSKLNIGSMACSMSEVQVLLGLGVVFGTAFLGKLFCSHVCPLGTVSEWLGRIGDKLKIRRSVNAQLDRGLRSLKYILLFITVYFTMQSSELFCKQYDPFFASVTGFASSDTIWYWALTAVVITIAGSLLFKLFWCKYLCPLGAFSNVFLNPILSVSIVLLYLGLNFNGVGLGYGWLLFGLVLAGWTNETGLLKSFFFPLPKIHRVHSLCTKCNVCEQNCPQGIKITQMQVVEHIDCTLCTDCVKACPKSMVLSVAKKKSLTHLAPVATILVIAVSLIAARYFEFTTISLRWGAEPKYSAVFTYEGLKTITCYGSSMALAGTLEGVKGIYGVDTYAKSQSVKVYYNPTEITALQVKQNLFSASKQELYEIADTSVTKIGVLKVGIYGLFDAVDFSNLSLILKQLRYIAGFETAFGEPVQTTIYFDMNKISANRILAALSQKEVNVSKKDGIERVVVNFRPAVSTAVPEVIAAHEYRRRIFQQYDDGLGRYEFQNSKDLKVYVFTMPEILESENYEKLELLAAHLSVDQGIIRVLTRYNHGPECCLYFNPEVTSAEQIQKKMKEAKLSYYISDTEMESVDNPFKKHNPGQVITASAFH